MKIYKAALVTALTASLLGAGSAVAANAATDNQSVSATQAPVTTPAFADALAAYNTAAAALAATSADASATNAAKQQAYSAAKQAYNQLLRSALDARAVADKAFRDAIKVANDNYRASRATKGLTADQKLAAQNAFTGAVADAATARDRAYASLAMPAAPTQPVLAPKPGKQGQSGKGPKN